MPLAWVCRLTLHQVGAAGSRDLPDLAGAADAKWSHFQLTFRRPGLAELIHMRTIHVDPSRPARSIQPGSIPSLSDDECVARLARALAKPDSARLDEVAALIGRLAVALE